MTSDWSVELPAKFKRRIEDECLVLWKPGFTIWTIAWSNTHRESIEERLDWISRDTSAGAFDILTESSEGLVRYAYRLQEESEEGCQASFYGYAIGRNGHIQMAIYFDSPDDLEEVSAIWRSLREGMVA